MPLGDIVAAVADSEVLRGDLRDAILDRLKAMPRPWTTMSEAQQRDMIGSVDLAARELIRKAVALLAANGFPALPAKLVKAQIKDGLQCQVDLSRHDPQRDRLLDHMGKPVMIVLADLAEFMGEREPAKPDPDQPELPGGDGKVAPFKAK